MLRHGRMNLNGILMDAMLYTKIYKITISNGANGEKNNNEYKLETAFIFPHHFVLFEW